MSCPAISPADLARRQQNGEPITLIDVRTPLEFQEVHIPFAKNIPLDALDAAAVAKEYSRGSQPIYIVCRSGSRGRQACERLQAAGHAQVVNVEGGTSAWDQAGLPVNRGKKSMSLERQVRIAAGLLVVIGAGLGMFVHPYWMGLSAFVGAGLVFAGLTDTCGMGLLLARMPWNKVCTKSPASSAKSTNSNNGPACSR